MKNNPRPIIEWLNELPELIRELVIKDCKNKNMIALSMADAINDSCFWLDTNIGEDFYFGLYFDAKYHEQNNIKLPR